MISALVFFFLWILSLFLGYKFVLLNIKEVEKYPQRYFDFEDKNK
ncbi:MULTISPECIES: hypothetical protein [Campylobacter]|nr:MULTISPECIES: hypothetical protein [unclassified Campylobacter]